MELNKVMTWICMILLISTIVSAIGVSPIRRVVDFEPNKEYDLSVKIRNDGHKDIKAIVYARGDLAQYIGIVDSLVAMSNGESEKMARYSLKLPSNFERPGVHKADIVVMEYPSTFGTPEQTMVSAVASVVSELWLRVPFPGKYAEAKLYIDAGDIGKNVNFAISVMNFGKEDIEEVKVKIKIIGATYEEIAEIEIEGGHIPAKGQSKLTGSWLADVNPGRYHAVVEVEYDEKKTIIEQNFEVGSLYIGIKKINVKEFSLGDVAVFDILLESRWNEQINNVYGEMTVLDEGGTEYTTIKTASIDIPAMGEGLLKAYWDTEGMSVGKYALKLLIHYASKVTEKLIDAEVNIDSIRTEFGPTAKVIAGKGMGRDTLLTVLVIILIAINVAWFAYFMKVKKK